MKKRLHKKQTALLMHNANRQQYLKSELGFLKVSKFQNEIMETSFLPNYEPKIVRISAL